MPTDKDAVENVACPLLPTGDVASTFEPSRNVIVPVGVPAPGATTLKFAVRVIDVFRVGEFAEEVSAVAVDA